MNHPEYGGDTEAEETHMTGESEVGDIKDVKESADEVETEVGEVVYKVIKRIQSYGITFYIGVFISYEEMNQHLDSKGMSLTYHLLFQDIEIKVIKYQVSRWLNIKYNHA